MRHFAFILLSLITLVAGIAGFNREEARAEASSSQRLVVFEGFLRPT